MINLVFQGFPFVCLAYDEIQHCMAVGATDGKVILCSCHSNGCFCISNSINILQNNCLPIQFHIFLTIQVRIFDLKEESSFRSLHEMDINQKLARLMDSTQAAELSTPKGGIK